MRCHKKVSRRGERFEAKVQKDVNERCLSVKIVVLEIIYQLQLE